LTHIDQTWCNKLSKHIKTNIEIDIYENDLNSEKTRRNQYELNKLEGNQYGGKKVFDVKLNELGKTEHDGHFILIPSQPVFALSP
jgi:hypothetical protein